MVGHVAELALLAAGVLKGAEQVVYGTPLMGVAVLVACATMALVNVRLGAALLAVAVLPQVAWSSHVLLIAATAMIVAGFPDRQQRDLLIATQLTAMYLFVSIAKLGPAWLSGAVLTKVDGRLLLFDRLPLWIVVYGTLAVELAMAALLWMDRRVALAVGTVLHLSIIVGMWSGVEDTPLRLVAFNGLAIGLLVAVYRDSTTAQEAPSG